MENGKNHDMKAKKNLATTYSPTDELQYHRRGSVLLTCSGWERVFPLRYGHQTVVLWLISSIKSSDVTNIASYIVPIVSNL